MMKPELATSVPTRTHIAHLVVAISDPNPNLLDEWTWLIGTEKSLHLIAACGDVFLIDSRDGTIHYLDVSASELSQVAASEEVFETLLSEPQFIDAYLRSGRVKAMRHRGLILKKNQIYSFKTPLSLGGQVNVENIEIADVEVHFSIAGQIERQIADVPLGTRITGIKIDRLPGTKPWWRFW
jgi:hypothetical protein